MSLRSLPPLLRQDPALLEVVGRPNAVLAVPEPARAFVVAGLAHLSGREPMLVAVPTRGEADALARDLAAYLGSSSVWEFPAWETLPFERVSPGVETMGRRLEVMWGLRQGGEASSGPRVVVAPVRALVQRLGPRVEDTEPLTVAQGDVVELEQLVSALVASGYRREYQVEHRGEVAVRGGIVDVFPSTAEAPVRIDLWGDEVDRLTEFDVSDQRSVHDLERAEIFGCRELVPTEPVRRRASELTGEEPWGRAQWERLAQGSIFDGMESFLPWLVDGEHLLPDLLGPRAQVVLVEPRRMRDRATELADEEASLARTLAETWGAQLGEQFPTLYLPFDRLLAHTRAPVWSITSVAEGPDGAAVTARGWDLVGGEAAQVAGRLRSLVADRYRVVVCADGRGTAGRMAATLREEGLAVPVRGGGEAETTAGDGDGASGSPAGDGTAASGSPAGDDTTATDLTQPGARVVVQPLERGFVIPSLRLAVVAESDLTGRSRPHRRPRARARPVDGFFDDLKVGDYVVHHQHGVARYAGMVQRAIGGSERDYLLLEYRGGDRLYVPSDQIDAVTPYGGGESPTLHRLGGSDWQRAKARVRSAAREIALELVELYRARASMPGHAFSPDTPWQREVEESFPYTETPDQLTAISQVKADMEEEQPMDRLVCGDVGFGKTEVAIRAVFKAVQDGKQAAVLVPTTLLAQQHFQTFSERMAGFPVRIEVLSRFLTPRQSERVVQGMADGAVDVVIGTHRLLSQDITFKDLGLLVVDEEQRFGVSHKEAIKRATAGVDVLTLAATPIPRTLELSLTGLRDLTLLNTPPADRQPILTYVGEYDERAVSEALRRELLREGQVFFVHNRVSDIEQVASRLRQMVPEARVVVAHGQMDEGMLERVALEFWEGKHDVLVCTTIIESGIDMPTVNTLVVDRADHLGLGQLHQLRGRVGRAGQRAYAYLFVPADRRLTEEAYERLRTIGEHTELGSGFKIAMRDLEVRGAGNLLGSDQSGHIAAVGYDLYVRLVSEAVAEVKGEPYRAPAEIKLDLPVEAHLPSSYVGREDLRLEAYRRLAAVTSPDEVEDVAAEWADRFGPSPASALALLEVARLRAECARTGVREVTVTAARPGGATPGRAVARLAPLSLPASARVRLQRLYPGAVYKEDLQQVVAPLGRDTKPPPALVELLRALVPVAEEAALPAAGSSSEAGPGAEVPARGQTRERAGRKLRSAYGD